MATLGLIVLLSLSVPQGAPAAPSPGPVLCEFRAFDGADEVTRDTRVRVYPDGRRDDGVAADAAGRLSLQPGLYDVQVIRERDRQVTAIRWLEHMLVQRYPDEGGRHLEVINFKPTYGALQLKAAEQAGYEATAFAPGDHARPVAAGLAGQGYVLLVVPAGRYDVRVRSRVSAAPEVWLTDLDVPVDRTRLRLIRPPDATPRIDR